MYKNGIPKIINLLDTTSDDKDLPMFVTKKWTEVYDQSEKNYNINKEIRVKTPMPRSDLCEFSDAYIVMKADIALGGNNNANKRKKNLAFKNNAPFINCITKINGIKIDNAEDLDVVMPMYNLLEYSKNYKKTTGSLWNYYRDEPSSTIGANNITHSILNSESFDYKANFMENGVTHNNLTKNNAKVVIPLKHLSKFWRSLNIPLINCEVELILTWSKNCVLADMTVDVDADPAIVAPSGVTFKIKDKKLYIPVVTLSKENDIKLLEQLKTGFKRTIKWNKYRSQMSIQNNNNNLNYLTDPTFTNVNRLFVLSFERIEENNVKKDYRDFYSHYYVPKVQMKYFTFLIDGKSFFDLPVKNEEEAYEKNIEMSNNNDYMTGNLLDFAYYKENYRLIAIDLSKQTKLKDPQQINFIGKIEGQNNGVTMFFIIERLEETTFEFSQNSVTII